MVKRRPLPHQAAGFSLVEVLVTIAIMGLMLTAVTQMLSSVRMSRDLIHNEQERFLAGPAILDLIERDLAGVFVTGIPRAKHMRIEEKVLGGNDAYRIDFFTTTDSLVWHEEGDRQLRSDYGEVGYCLRRSPLDEDFLELYRREGFGIDEDSHREGRYIFLNDRVRGFRIQVYSERGPEDQLDPREDWGLDESDPETQGLPAFILIELDIELEPRLLRETLLTGASQLQTYRRIISLPEELRYEDDQDIPRLRIPSAVGSGPSNPLDNAETGDESDPFEDGLENLEDG